MDSIEISDFTSDKNKKQIHKPHHGLKKFFNILFGVIFVIVLLCGGGIIFHNMYFTGIFVNGQSMYPTLNRYATNASGGYLNDIAISNINGCRVDYGIVNTKDYAINDLTRFSIIATYYTSDWDSTRDKPIAGTSLKIKRVIGLPGDTVYIDTNCDLFVNNTYCSQDFIDYTDCKEDFKANNIKNTTKSAINVTLGEDEYYVLGDNRGHSGDSRTNGLVKKKYIYGVLFCIEAMCTTVTNTSGTYDLQNFSYHWPKFY